MYKGRGKIQRMNLASLRFLIQKIFNQLLSTSSFSFHSEYSNQAKYPQETMLYGTMSYMNACLCLAGTSTDAVELKTHDELTMQYI